MPRSRSRGLLLCAVLQACGCSALAQKTPTPAAQLNGQELSRLPVPPNERYYLLLFGSQDALHRPKYTHTWATVVKATCTPGCPDPALEVHTISWLPTSLDIRPLSREVEPGTNLGLNDTLNYVLGGKEKVVMWGPYQVSYPFTVRFLTQKAFLDSGAVGYQCDDVIGEAARYGNGCDCIHAITDMDPLYPRWRYPLAVYGVRATANTLRRFMHSPVFIEPRTTHDWLIGRLGLDQYPIHRRTYHGRVDPDGGDGTGDLDGGRAVLRPPTPPPVPGPQGGPPAPTSPGVQPPAP